MQKQYKFREALFEVIDLARKGNKYLQEKEPWILAKNLASNPENQEGIDNCLHICLQLCANLSILINPFLPFTAKKLIYMMKVVEKMLDWENAGKTKLLSVGYSLREPQLLFRKIEDEEVAAQVEKLQAGTKKLTVDSLQLTGNSQNTTVDSSQSTVNSQPSTDLKAEIVFDDFAKIDLKVGTILTAEKVAKADKLLKLEIDLGFETRTIVSGIALHYQPDQIIGKQVVVVVNLAPRKMKGVESRGMILMAEDAGGKLHFVSPENMINTGAGVS
jgi:methionyl-tRNA synthetase